MKLLKRLYLGMVAAWLLFCLLRIILPYMVANYYKADFSKYHCETTYFVDCDRPYNRPLAQYAELNERLCKAQPSSQFFFAPALGWDYYKGIILTPMLKNPDKMTEEANAVLEAWYRESIEQQPTEIDEETENSST
ncbi:MAG: hypothetical protein IJ498_08380 [Akkermansia sp.]|nr:hypothetical protein [Akkermansia sp.]